MRVLLWIFILATAPVEAAEISLNEAKSNGMWETLQKPEADAGKVRELSSLDMPNALLTLAALFNLGGADIVIVILILAFWLAVIAGIVWFVKFLTRSRAGSDSAGLRKRIEALDLLRSENKISEAEYAEQRKRILSEV